MQFRGGPSNSEKGGGGPTDENQYVQNSLSVNKQAGHVILFLFFVRNEVKLIYYNT